LKTVGPSVLTWFEQMFEPALGGVADVDEVLFGVLADHVTRYLDAIDRLAVADIRVEARRLAAAWRALLAEHRPAWRGGCSECRRRRGSRPAFCGVWRVACGYFVYQAAGDGPVTG
jgi:hypothetical protein